MNRRRPLVASAEGVMDHEAERQLAQRGTILTVSLTVMGGSLVCFFLCLAGGGVGILVLAVMAGIGVFGLIHYFLWGHALSAEVAGEDREGEPGPAAGDEIPDRQEATDWTAEERSW